MNGVRRPWLRGVVALGVIGAVSAGLLIAPVGAAGKLTKKKVKKIATRLDNSLAARVGAVSTAVSANPGMDVPMTEAYTPVATATISLPAARRVFSSATLSFLKLVTSPSEVSCLTRMDGAAVGFAGVAELGEAEAYDAQVSVLGAGNLGPGSHTVEVVCSKTFGADTLFLYGDLLVWAA